MSTTKSKIPFSNDLVQHTARDPAGRAPFRPKTIFESEIPIRKGTPGGNDLKGRARLESKAKSKKASVPLDSKVADTKLTREPKITDIL